MNKIGLLLAVWLSIAIISCSKKDDNQLQQAYIDNANFAISMPTEFSVEKGKAVLVNVVIAEGTNGTAQEEVSISVSGLPPGITYTVSPLKGTPTYNAQIMFHTSASVDEGVYNIKVLGSTPSGATKVVDAKLTVLPVENCAAARAGLYNVLDACTTGTYNYMSQVTTVTGNADVVYINNFADLGTSISVMVTLDCADNTLTIPSQTLGLFTISGSGTFTNNQITLNYTVASASQNESCTMTMTK